MTAIAHAPVVRAMTDPKAAVGRIPEIGIAQAPERRIRAVGTETTAASNRATGNNVPVDIRPAAIAMTAATALKGQPERAATTPIAIAQAVAAIQPAGIETTAGLRSSAQGNRARPDIRVAAIGQQARAIKAVGTDQLPAAAIRPAVTGRPDRAIREIGIARLGRAATRVETDRRTPAVTRVIVTVRPKAVTGAAVIVRRGRAVTREIGTGRPAVGAIKVAVIVPPAVAAIKVVATDPPALAVIKVAVTDRQEPAGIRGAVTDRQEPAATRAIATARLLPAATSDTETLSATAGLSRAAASARRLAAATRATETARPGPAATKETETDHPVPVAIRAIGIAPTGRPATGPPEAGPGETAETAAAKAAIEVPGTRSRHLDTARAGIAMTTAEPATAAHQPVTEVRVTERPTGISGTPVPVIGERGRQADTPACRTTMTVGQAVTGNATIGHLATTASRGTTGTLAIRRRQRETARGTGTQSPGRIRTGSRAKSARARTAVVTVPRLIAAIVRRATNGPPPPGDARPARRSAAT